MMYKRTADTYNSPMERKQMGRTFVPNEWSKRFAVGQKYWVRRSGNFCSHSGSNGVCSMGKTASMCFFLCKDLYFSKVLQFMGRAKDGAYLQSRQGQLNKTHFMVTSWYLPVTSQWCPSPYPQYTLRMFHLCTQEFHPGMLVYIDPELYIYKTI